MSIVSFFKRSVEAFDLAWTEAFGPPAPSSEEDKISDYQMSLSETGVKGEIKSVSCTVDREFFIERLFVSETSERGLGTKIKNVYVGERSYFNLNKGILSYVFGTEVSNTRLNLGSVHEGTIITFQIEFLESCTWCCTLLGTTSREDCI